MDTHIFRGMIVLAVAASLAGCTPRVAVRNILDGHEITLVSVPKVGDELPIPEGAISSASRGGMIRMFAIVVDGVRYAVDVPGNAPTVLLVTTTDGRFRSPEGLAVGDRWATAKRFSVANASPDYGTHCAVQLRSGWLALFEVPCGVLGNDARIIRFDLQASDHAAAPDGR